MKATRGLLRNRKYTASSNMHLGQNQDFDWRKMSKFDETLQTDQIEGAEFKFLGLEDRFERNKRNNFLNAEIEILEPKSKIRLG